MGHDPPSMGWALPTAYSARLSHTTDAPLSIDLTLLFGNALRMPNYRRIWIPGGTYFFTVALADRQSALLANHIAELRTAFRIARRARPFATDAIVILPDHIHAIWTLPPGDADYATRWAHIKAMFSRALPAAGERPSTSRARK